MAYRIEGLARQRFADLEALSDTALAERGAIRLTADSERGYPCRVSLDHAAPGESVLLLNHVSNDAPTPYRTAFAIFVRERRGDAAVYVDRLPPVLEGRMLSLRGYDAAGMLREALLTSEPEAGIERLFAEPEIESIHAHTAAYGCFLAKIGRA